MTVKDSNNQSDDNKIDYRETLSLPKTDFPMRAGLPKLEEQIINKWYENDIYGQLRNASKDKTKYILHDGPPYANGHIHMGTALNKVLKDIVVRSQQSMGKNSDYVPGWDCHGLPIEWKIEEQYRQKNKNKDEVEINQFRHECREFAQKWVDIQKDEFKRLGVVGDWNNPYTTMDFKSEAVIANELMKFALNGTLYRGSKPVMWSVVEQTALAEAEIEYDEKQSPTIYVKFALKDFTDNALNGAAIIIWTTTPWTIPGNRAIAYSSKICYGLYEVTKADDENWTKIGEKLLVADDLAEAIKEAGRIDDWQRISDIDPSNIKSCHHPLSDDDYYQFSTCVLEGDFVTSDSGTGFVHIAPSHGADDYQLYENNRDIFAKAGTKSVPQTVREDGYYFDDVGIFGGDENIRVIDHKGKWGKANDRVIDELVRRNALLARGRITHDYPHSWRSKKPVIFRNTPQWFIAIDKPFDKNKPDNTIRSRALNAINETKFTPNRGQNRLKSMIENRPDWVISRQRAWGVPITVFINDKGEYIPNKDFAQSNKLISRITESFVEHGADTWFEEGSKDKYLKGLVNNPDEWEQVTDILDVWFDSGSTHAFCLEQGTIDKKWNLQWPADLYLEGSDQHRGWFHSSLLESCGTRDRAPYNGILTHGFVVDENGRKMSKSLGNIVSPTKISNERGAEILRLWVASSDYAEDLRIGDEVIKSNVDSYRKLRNTFRFMLGNLNNFSEANKVEYNELPELEMLLLHELFELDLLVRQAYNDFDFKKIFARLFNFLTVDLSAFYFDIRKDSLYCDPIDTLQRRSSLTVLDILFKHLSIWFSPILCFTMEEAWSYRYPEDKSSIHLKTFPDIPSKWKNIELHTKWDKIRKLRNVVTGSLEVERSQKNIGSSLEAAPKVYINDDELLNSLSNIDFAEICITSQIEVIKGEVTSSNEENIFRLDDAENVSVIFAKATGQKCQRCWKILDEVGQDKDYPDLCLRDAEAVRKYIEIYGKNA